MRWTEEAIEDLKRLASEGRSASVIATELGAASRNAVIGKASRMGIRLNGDGRASTPGRTRGAARPAPLAGAARLRAGDRIHGGAFALAMWARRKDGGRSASAFGEAEVGEMLRVRFDEIRQPACRWPLGDPRSGEFAFCGLMPLNGRSYCPGHCRMAYRPPNAAAGPRERQGLRALSRCWLF